jgi:hypothetical protein
MLLSDVLQEAFWTDAYPASEEALKMVFTQVDIPGNLAQGGLPVSILL